MTVTKYPRQSTYKAEEFILDVVMLCSGNGMQAEMICGPSEFDLKDYLYIFSLSSDWDVVGMTGARGTTLGPEMENMS
jgi:hypothetical protein